MGLSPYDQPNPFGLKTQRRLIHVPSHDVAVDRLQERLDDFGSILPPANSSEVSENDAPVLRSDEAVEARRRYGSLRETRWWSSCRLVVSYADCRSATCHNTPQGSMR